MKDIKVGSIVVCVKDGKFIKEGAIGLVVSVETPVFFNALWSKDLSLRNDFNVSTYYNNWHLHTENAEIIGNID